MTSFVPVSINQELRNSYLTYSVSIFNRALPDVTDGLKVAQRRIILGLKDLKLKPDGAFKKVSRLEGHVLGSYHPQGGCAGTAINMGQANGFRYLLTNIHGNVGGSIQSGPSTGQSISEDAPAAARYLEVKSSEFTQSIYINEIDKESCEWRDNYDGSTKEVHRIVPALPALLVNGGVGIAAGYACHHISYNLSEVINGTVAYIKNKNITNKALYKHITGPDLPQGARILKDDGVYAAFSSGHGSIKVYGKWEVKKVGYKKKSKRDAIIVTSLASGSSERFLEKVKSAVDAGKIDQIVDAADHSSTEGIHIELVLKANANAQQVISELLAYTNLYDTVGVNAMAIKNALPEMFGVKEIISAWHESRCSALISRYSAECKRIMDRMHILDGFLTILANIDEVIKTIKSSKTRETASNNLCKKWKLSIPQAQAVLSMPLSRLVNAERLELQSEKEELQEKYNALQSLIQEKDKMDTHIIEQLRSFRQFSDKRRTELVDPNEIGAEKAKVVAPPRVRKIKPLTPQEIYKRKGKELGMKRTVVAKFLEGNKMGKDIASKWEEFVEDWEHEQQMTTRKGAAKRKKLLEELKKWGKGQGMRSRGQYAWNAFIEGREKTKIRVLKEEMKEWLANIDAI
ncbi:MAG: DNA topoisomerase (ATP-hydrolyzing) subunit A [Schleiferiaceae bacterium]